MKRKSASTVPLKQHAPPGDGAFKLPALKVLSEIATSLSGDENLDALLGRFLGTLVRVAGAEAGAVRVLTEDGASLRLVASLGLPEEVVEHERLVDMECGLCGQAVKGNRILEEAAANVCLGHSGLDYFRPDCRRLLAVPLQHKGRVLGVYNLFFSAPGEVPEEVRLLFQSISEHLGMALENARLARENLRITLMNERQMLANELHDSVAQNLAYLKMRLALLEEGLDRGDAEACRRYLSDSRGALDAAYADLREILTHFRSRMAPHGLLHTLRETVDGFYDRTGVMLDYANYATDFRLTVEQEVQVFHIVQEALANVSRHSGAQHARLILDERDGQYLVTVEDDGHGLPEARSDPGRRVKEHASFGLSIMRERAQRLGGRLEVESFPEHGTRLRLVFPRATVEPRP